MLLAVVVFAIKSTSLVALGTVCFSLHARLIAVEEMLGLITCSKIRDFILGTAGQHALITVFIVHLLANTVIVCTVDGNCFTLEWVA